MGCGTDMVCGTHIECGSNSECSGFQASCGGNQTSWVETIVSGTTIVQASHISELESAINAERTHGTRRCLGTSTACGSNCPGAYTFTGSRGVGDIVDADHINNIADSINTTPYNVNGNSEGPDSAVANPLVNVGDIISKSDIDTLRSAINVVESNCICDSYCSCDVNCGCFNQYVCACNTNIY